MQTALCKIALFVNLSYLSVNLLHLYTKSGTPHIGLPLKFLNY